jgi:O-antigen/teichoic acid export membrane protein
LSIPYLKLQINRGNIISNTITLFSGSALAQGMTILALLFTARQLGAPSYGLYAANFALASITSFIYNLGLDIWILREGGRKPENLAKVIGSVTIIKFIGGILWLLLITTTASNVRGDIFFRDLVFYSALVVFFDNLFNSTLATFKASLKNRYTIILETSSDTAWLLATIYIIHLGVVNPILFLQVRIITLGISLLISFILVYRKIGIKADLSSVKQALQEAPPFAISEFLAWIYMRADVIIIAMFLNKAAVGIYSPAVGLVNALYLIPSAIYFVLTPVLSNLISTANQKTLSTAKYAMIISFFVGIGLFIGLRIFIELFIDFLGPTYFGTKDVLRILSINLFFHSLSFILASLLVALNLQQKRVIVQAIAVLFNIIFNLLVINRWGILGISWVYVITEIIILLGYSVLVFKNRVNLISF